MFTTKSKNLLNETVASATSIIGAGTVITGNVESNGDIRIDGKVLGDVTAKAKILVGPEGVIEGNIVGEQADVLGKVIGVIKVNDLLHLRGKATVNGDIYASKLQLEPSVTFNGQCHMGANVVALNAELSNAVNQ